MLKHYELEVTIFVTGKNWRGNDVAIPFYSNDYEYLMVFGCGTVKGFYNSEISFRNAVRDMEHFMIEQAEQRVKQTFFKKRNYVLNHYDKVFEPKFMTLTGNAEITDPQKFKIDYLKKHLSALQFARLFKKVYEEA